MREQRNLTQSVDWVIIMIYAGLVIMGWLNIYAAVYDPSLDQSIFEMRYNSGKQLVWIFLSIPIIIAIMVIDFNFYDKLAYVVYGLLIFTLVFVLVFGREVAGSKSWLDLGFARLQPSEFAKFATAIGLAKVISMRDLRLEKFSDFMLASIFVIVPAGLIILQGDTGSAIVFGSFIIMFYREGFPGFLVGILLFCVGIFIVTLFARESFFNELILTVVGVGVAILALLVYLKKKRGFWITLFGFVLAVGLIYSVDFIISDVMKPHQRKRIEILVDPNKDPTGAGWQVTQSKIAIGSGGFTGKGFLEGTQTKFDFVPDQSTDFIFCTVGEEHGYLGSFIVVILFIALLFRVTQIAERQKSRFSRVYGYSVAGIFFFHFMINIGMTIGVFPVIGIPLPFFSYGGSSLWSFTFLLFILVKLDAHRMQILARY
ncbi:rod shape-determining protein RodA [Flammeovirgaceae bacterium SG7u.111]|nr:rod shape-determining protein RodA [Flammeovirgaceae bacterium SG7u.132]WPO37440.1 rod shape-determining protein RodA [Flammeovirgaceae bacterium SG7u.111]